MSRKALSIVAVVLAVVLAGGAAYAAFAGRLRGSGSASALRITWDTAFGTSDATGQFDPLKYGMTLTAAERDTVDVGMTTNALVSGEPVVSITGLYDGYRATVRNSAKVTGGGSNTFVLQSVALTAPIPAGLAVFLNPAQCGIPLGSTATTLEIGIGQTGVPVSDTSAFTFEVKIVPQSAYVAGSCNGWPTT